MRECLPSLRPKLPVDRIEKLEATDMRLTKRFIWEDGIGSAEREIARLRAAGESSEVEFIIVSWLPREKVQ